MKLSDDVQVDVPVIPTGSIGLDQALELAAYPVGGLLKFLGRNLPAKPRYPAHYCRMPKMGGICAFIDAEHALMVALAPESLGTNTDELLISSQIMANRLLI